MSVNPVKRKLAAILAADAVGYSRMMAEDEEGTMKVLSAHRSVIDGKFASDSYQGRGKLGSRDWSLLIARR
jgi:hypothetical protein